MSAKLFRAPRLHQIQVILSFAPAFSIQQPTSGGKTISLDVEK